jgi:ATP-dependent DNA helicase RecG
VTTRTLRYLSRTPISELKSVPARKVSDLRALGIATVLDLLTYYPRRYADRTREAEIAALVEGEEAAVTAEVVSSSSRRLRGGRSSAEIVLDDGTGSLTCVFFNQAWRARQFRPGERVTAFGKVSTYRAKRQMANPLVDLVGDQTGRIVPIYPQSGKSRVNSVDLARYVAEALERAGELAEPVPDHYLRDLGLIGRTAAYRNIHSPETMADTDRARLRLAFDELLRLQLLLVRRKRVLAASSVGVVHDTSPGRLVADFVRRLPFELTAAQRRAIREVACDLARPHPMSRLLQGDVGAGKTVVAAAALLYCVQGGHQGALMVPTEVLAEQHYLSLRRLLEGLMVPDTGRLAGERPLEFELLTSRVPPAERARVLASLASGQLDIIVGTQALLTGDVRFSSLGAVVVDEQHRFGVEQRAALAEKGLATRARAEPDLLVMTATPIPRTAAMTVYGDLDHTTLDELPPGRTAIATKLVSWSQQAAVWKRVTAELDAGHQAYVVCPLVGGGATEEEGWEEEPDIPAGRDEMDGTELQANAGGRFAMDTTTARPPPRAAADERDRLAASDLAGYRVGLLHGQLTPRDKESAMGAFRAGEIQVLVATSVVEVGVDVANATVMVIEDADRFGIAQLHQLRGRVGRSAAKSYCFLLADPVTEISAGRLEALVKTESGFELAEIDLALRGGGTVLGSRQKGRTDLKLASLGRHRALVTRAREVATDVVDRDPELDSPLHKLLWDEVEVFVSEEERQFLFRS